MNRSYRRWIAASVTIWGHRLRVAVNRMRHLPVFWGRCPQDHTGTAIVLCPFSAATVHCGLAGLISVQRKATPAAMENVTALEKRVADIQAHPLSRYRQDEEALIPSYLGGAELLDNLYTLAGTLKRVDHFILLFADSALQSRLARVSTLLDQFIQQETKSALELMGHLSAKGGETVDHRIEKLKDVAWCLNTELLANLSSVKALMPADASLPEAGAVTIYHNINTVLNSIDRLEVRGRDSAGVSLLFILDRDHYQAFRRAVSETGKDAHLTKRLDPAVLVGGAVSVRENETDGSVGITLTYKVAAEIGSLGDNVRQLRSDIAADELLYLLAGTSHRFHTVSSHTRWASVGAISIANCHPVDNTTKEPVANRRGIIHACLNGDIDNYLELKKAWEAEGGPIPDEVTTDTKIIPLQIETYVRRGHPAEEAFRLAVNDFEGSHAIAMHTDLAPGKFFLAQKGSGQAVFVGLAADHYLPASEVYGFVEETSTFIKLNGEKVVQSTDGPTQGQLFILDQTCGGGLEGIRAMYYDGTPIELTPADIQTTQITSRDIDRQNFPHYFLKEISEAPVSVARTLQNRWKVPKEDPDRRTIALDEKAFPAAIASSLESDQIRRVYFIGQGTAGVAAQAIADILAYYLNDPTLKISAMKASELSGFRLGDQNDPNGMADTLVVAISQSGTTTDTNRTVDMVKARGARTLAIVNRRDSDITFKVDGVIYTSSGRDIEMSVASTKAFYSQIVAGALLSLKIAQIKQRRSAAFVTEEITALLALPDQMRAVLATKERIEASARRLAPQKTYWAAVGSGPNKAAADEIRIKLSELCYKTISSDFVEDKKHIDLSSEPLIIVCAAGTTGTVIGDIIKDTAIFKAHKATPVIIVDEGESRFDPYAADVFQVPRTSPHLAPILNTLAGHLWGYYAALALNNGSKFLHQFRQEVQNSVDQYSRDGLDVYEVVLEKSFREQMIEFYAEFRKRQAAGQIPSTISHATDLMLLLKYLAGRLPVTDFEMDFGKKGTALNMLRTLFTCLGESINGMSRPVDAIKHQAKTVTVGTSRISEKIGGILFEALENHGIGMSQLITRNILVLRNLQEIVAGINGSILYRIDKLDALGELTNETTIAVLRKEGILKSLPSRVENDTTLKGTKRIIVRNGNVYIGKGRKDDRSILIIPAISTDPSASNRIEYLLLLNIDFIEDVSLPVRVKALGGKYENIKNIVQENSIIWDDHHLELVPMDELFGRSAEKIGEKLVASLNKR
jgi:glucosamine--fructose-6-phosphate aminotransferase (isomerizing)